MAEEKVNRESRKKVKKERRRKEREREGIYIKEHFTKNTKNHCDGGHDKEYVWVDGWGQGRVRTQSPWHLRLHLRGRPGLTTRNFQRRASKR